jgi:hypothetical protein
MVIDGIEYRPVTDSSSPVKIVVCDRGFVLVGRVEIKDSYVTISDCSCIRNWGTSKGLGEIASGGPTSSTKMDAQPTTRVHELQVVQLIDCEASKWKL